jgi:soluble lytic murein transglycosylase-like protein
MERSGGFTDRMDIKLMCGQWKQFAWVLVLCSLSAFAVNAQDNTPNPQPKVIGNVITLADGYSFEVDEVWKQGDETWYRKGTITQRVSQPVKSVKPVYEQPKPGAVKTAPAITATAAKSEPSAIWIYLVDGARFRVDEVQESSDGALYTRNKVSIFLDKERIARIEYEVPSPAPARRANADWTSGSAAIDQLIRTNASRFGMDPYLVFLVIEKESRFHPRAVSPKGAMGLMQLMPGTARRLGVKRAFDAAENIRAGTRYLRELMDRFSGKVELVLASYNAGEGAVIKYGRNVPPYRETQDYVKTIGKRYGLTGRQPGAQNEVPDPQR